MDFKPTEEQEAVRRVARQFAEERLMPHAAARDASGAFPVAELRELAKLGLLGVAVPDHLGGAGADPVAYSLAMKLSSAG